MSNQFFEQKVRTGITHNQEQQAFQGTHYCMLYYFFLDLPDLAETLGSSPLAKASCFFNSSNLTTSSSTFGFSAFAAFNSLTLLPLKTKSRYRQTNKHYLIYKQGSSYIIFPTQHQYKKPRKFVSPESPLLW